MCHVIIYYSVNFETVFFLEPLIPGLRNQKQADFWEFETSLFYGGSLGTASSTQRNPVSKIKNQQTPVEYIYNNFYALLLELITES